MKKYILLCVLFSTVIAGCASMLPVRDVHDFCSIAAPIYLEKGEAAKLSQKTQDEILAHNRTWKKVCKK